MRKNSCWIIVLIFLLFACNGSPVFDEVEGIPEAGWEADSKMTFTIPISDTTNSCDIFVHLRNSNDYSYSNLWLFITTTSPAGHTLCDTVEFVLAEPDGKWLGAGLGAISSVMVPYKTNIRFPNRGIYKFEVQQAMRSDILTGIMDVGIRIEERN